MSGFLGVLLAGGVSLPGTIGFSVNLLNTSASTGVRSASFTLLNDGTATKTPSGSTTWFTPTTAGIGSQVWVKVTVTSNTNSTASGTFGAWVSLTSGQTWSFSNSSTNVEGIGTCTLSFATDSAGGNVVGSGSANWDVGYAP